MRFFLLHSGQASASRLAKRVNGLVLAQDVKGITADDRVIRFGNTEDLDLGWTVNRRDALLSADSRRTLLKSLRRAGVACPRSRSAEEDTESKMHLLRHYRVPVFDLKALSCFRTESKAVWLSKRINQITDAFFEVPCELDDETKKVTQLAVRAVHALGLEFGLVSIGVLSKSRQVVLDVAATPVLKGRTLELYADAISDWMAQEEKNLRPDYDHLWMGADLEFMLRSRQGKMVMASRYFPQQGVVGCDDRTLAGDRTRRPLAEIRPEPATTPENLLANVKKALKKAHQFAKHSSSEWLAGSAPFTRYPIGGHLHFSGVAMSARLINLLDVYLGLPLMLIEDPETANRRRPKYGFLGDIRKKEHGGFEYRTPASFLVDPQITYAVFALADTIVRHHHELPYLPLHRQDYARAFYRSDRDYLLPLVEEAFRELAKTKTYAHYQAIIEPIVMMIRRDEVWDESQDIRRVWGLSHSSESKKRYTAS
jgi:hypothetical protein